MWRNVGGLQMPTWLLANLSRQPQEMNSANKNALRKQIFLAPPGKTPHQDDISVLTLCDSTHKTYMHYVWLQTCRAVNQQMGVMQRKACTNHARIGNLRNCDTLSHTPRWLGWSGIGQGLLPSCARSFLGVQENSNVLPKILGEVTF